MPFICWTPFTCLRCHSCLKLFNPYINVTIFVFLTRSMSLISMTVSFSCLLCHSYHEQSNSVCTMLITSWTVTFSCLLCHSYHKQAHSRVYDSNRFMNSLILKSTMSLNSHILRLQWLSSHELFHSHVYYATYVMKSLILMSTVILTSRTASFACLWCHSFHEHSHSYVYVAIIMPILPLTVPNLIIYANQVMNILILMSSMPLKSWKLSFSCHDSTSVMNILMSTMPLELWTFSLSCLRWHSWLVSLSCLRCHSWLVSFSCLRCHSCHEQSHYHVCDATHD